MKAKVKEHLSDDEDDSTSSALTTTEKPVKTLTREEIEQKNLENAPVIADSEISPAAYLFQNQEDQDDLNIFE
jgi:hypothetical protein